jgi:Zn-dependent peptidase ImmA (M78 family)
MPSGIETVVYDPAGMDAEKDAQQILKTVWAPHAADDAVPLPVNPFAIAQRLGIKAFTASLDEGVSGILVKRSGEDAEIYVHASDSPNRQRFTCAHELGHYVKRSAAGDEAWEYVEHRNLLTSQGTDPEEVYANRFAASLLMPEVAVRRLYAEPKEERGAAPPAAALAYEFGVSADAMHYRLVNLGLE